MKTSKQSRNRQLKSWQKSGGWRSNAFEWSVLTNHQLPPVRKPVSIAHPPMVMIASNEFYSGSATWFYELGAWACRSVDECLNFLLNKNAGAAQLELTRRGFAWKWIR